MPEVPDQGETTEVVLAAVLSLVGLSLLAVGCAQLSQWVSGAVELLTIEPIVIPVGLTFAVPGLLRARRLWRARRLARVGVDASAEVLEVLPTRARVGSSVFVDVRLRVLPVSGAAVETTLRWRMRPLDGTRLVPGARVAVRVDPTNPRAVVLV